jgi:hypothetical protein
LTASDTHPHRKKILVLFADEWDCSRTLPEIDSEFEFVFEGFDLFKFPENAKLFTFNVHKFAQKLMRKYRDASIAGIFTSDEQFGPVTATLIGERLGLPVLSKEALLYTQHKLFARRRHQQLIPEATPPFAMLDRAMLQRREIPMAFPFYVKPIKAAFSVLARKVNDEATLQRHLKFAWFEEAIIKRLVKPYTDGLRDEMVAREGAVVDGYTMICEGLIEGLQVTVNGYAHRGEIRMLGVVDSIMYPNTDQFMRFQYPSLLPESVQQRMADITTRLLKGIDFQHGMFNIEMMWNSRDDSIKVIEVNPRVAGQFFDLFEQVDGFSLFKATLALACNEVPVTAQRRGKAQVAASFVLRDFSGQGLPYIPGEREIETVRDANPHAHMHFYLKRAVDLKRELKWLGNYRYCVMNIAGGTLEEMFARFVKARDSIQFHPRAAHERHQMESLATLLATLPMGTAHAHSD